MSMIWVGIIALAILLAVAISVGRALDTWTHALEKSARAHASNTEVSELRADIAATDRMVETMVQAFQDDKKADPPPLPPLPSCLCGSIDLLLLNGYQRVRIVACQRCSKVFGVDAAGVRFDRHAEALPEYMTQRGMRALAREEMTQFQLLEEERLKPRPGPMSRGRGREPIERPSA